MALTKRWAGSAWGTNIGNMFVTLNGEDADLTGTLRMNERGVGARQLTRPMMGQSASSWHL